MNYIIMVLNDDLDDIHMEAEKDLFREINHIRILFLQEKETNITKKIEQFQKEQRCTGYLLTIRQLEKTLYMLRILK